MSTHRNPTYIQRLEQSEIKALEDSFLKYAGLRTLSSSWNMINKAYPLFLRYSGIQEPHSRPQISLGSDMEDGISVNQDPTNVQNGYCAMV